MPAYKLNICILNSPAGINSGSDEQGLKGSEHSQRPGTGLQVRQLKTKSQGMNIQELIDTVWNYLGSLWEKMDAYTVALITIILLLDIIDPEEQDAGEQN